VSCGELALDDEVGGEEYGRLVGWDESCVGDRSVDERGSKELYVWVSEWVGCLQQESRDIVVGLCDVLINVYQLLTSP
jgi:hypothetical protein